MCLYPRLIDNPKYKPNKKNGGVIPPCSDKRVKLVPIGCQQCIECRKQKARDWNVRIQEDIKTNRNAIFITLTFSTEDLKKLYEETEGTDYTKDNQVATLAVKRFRERWRKQFKKSIRHWLITELGHTGTEHLHIHGLLWTNEKLETIQKIWQYGKVWMGTYVNSKTVNYITKYVTKIDEKHKYYKPIILTSPGIGSNYTTTLDAKNNRYKPQLTREYYRSSTGHKLALPIYYRNKLYSDKERELLWLEKLNKNERWVLGIRIDITENQDLYYRVLKTAQEKNTRLGYLSNTINWEEEKYERQRRKLLQEERIKVFDSHTEQRNKSRPLTN